MGTEQVIPTITINQVGCFTVDGNILFYVTFHALTSLGIQFDEADESEISAVGYPKATCIRVEQYTRVDGIVVFHTIGCGYFNGFRIFEVGRFRVECLVPHGQDASVVSTSQATTGSSVDNQIAVSNLDDIGSGTATGTDTSFVP